jgi:alpha-ketoglutarate-dependent taurine dioxygenase
MSAAATQDPELPRAGQNTITDELEKQFNDWDDLHMGPRAHLRAERERLKTLRWEHLEVQPLGSTLGAEISGVDLRAPIPAPVFAEIEQALWNYKVIFFRDQPLDASEQLAFARQFGDLEIHPIIPPNSDFPELARFEKSEEMGGYENIWHHDVTWRETPSKLAILRAVEVPATGGDTLFADMVAAYAGLDDEWKKRIADISVVHDYMRAFGAAVPQEQKAAARQRFPEVTHPAVGTHEQTGQRYLYVNRAFVERIDGKTREESLAIIQHLARQAETPEYQCRFHWTKDAIAIWDNRAVQHYAASDYWPDSRVMERASVIGNRPVA